MNWENPKRHYMRQWSPIILALIIGVLIGIGIMQQLQKFGPNEVSVYSRQLQSVTVGPFEVTFHSTNHYVTADLTLTSRKSVKLDTMYLEAVRIFSTTQTGQMSTSSGQTLKKYGTFEGTLPVTIVRGETEHIRLFPIPSDYNSGKITGYMIDIGYN